MRALLLALSVLFVSGCCGSRTVTVEIPGETPPPTVVTQTRVDTVAAPPDTVFLPAPDVPVTATEPEVVVVYREARADTSRAFPVWHIGVDPLAKRLTVSGRNRDLTFALPVDGEVLSLTARGASSFDARVEGEPESPPPQRVRLECPAERPCPSGRGWRGYVLVFGLPLLTLVVGLILGRLSRFIL